MVLGQGAPAEMPAWCPSDARAGLKPQPPSDFRPWARAAGHTWASQGPSRSRPSAQSAQLPAAQALCWGSRTGGNLTPCLLFLDRTFPADPSCPEEAALLGCPGAQAPSLHHAGTLTHRMGEKLVGGFSRLGIKFKYYVEITKQIKSLLSGCHGLPLDNTFNEDYCPPGYSFRFAFYYQRTTYALLQDFH